MYLNLDACHKVEEIKWITLLGIRFWDLAYDRQVSNGLRVIAWPENDPSAMTEAIRSSSGIYVLQGLSGLRDFELCKYSLLDSPIEQRKYIVYVSDLRERFLPIVFGKLLPMPYPGIYPSDTDPPLADEEPWRGLPLLSAPTRPVSISHAVVRAQLVERATQKPAAHAFASITFNGRIWYGIADRVGDLVVHLSYPELKKITVGLPPNQEDIPASAGDQFWQLGFRIYYQAGGLNNLQGVNLPDLKLIMQQPPAKIFPSLADDAVDEQSHLLVYRQELVLKTENKSELFIEAV